MDNQVHDEVLEIVKSYVKNKISVSNERATIAKGTLMYRGQPNKDRCVEGKHWTADKKIALNFSKTFLMQATTSKEISVLLLPSLSLSIEGFLDKKYMLEEGKDGTYYLRLLCCSDFFKDYQSDGLSGISDTKEKYITDKVFIFDSEALDNSSLQELIQKK